MDRLEPLNIVDDRTEEQKKADGDWWSLDEIAKLKAELSQLRENLDLQLKTNDRLAKRIEELESAANLKDTALDKIEQEAPQCWWCGAIWVVVNEAGDLAKEHEPDCQHQAARKAGHE